jgi:hypothetical protein
VGADRGQQGGAGRPLRWWVSRSGPRNGVVSIGGQPPRLGRLLDLERLQAWPEEHRQDAAKKSSPITMSAWISCSTLCKPLC